MSAALRLTEDTMSTPKDPRDPKIPRPAMLPLVPRPIPRSEIPTDPPGEKMTDREVLVRIANTTADTNQTVTRVSEGLFEVQADVYELRKAAVRQDQRTGTLERRMGRMGEEMHMLSGRVGVIEETQLNRKRAIDNSEPPLGRVSDSGAHLLVDIEQA